MLKLFVDECVNTDVIISLKKLKLDILTVREAKLTGVNDEKIFKFAQLEKRILLTFDRGFGDIFRFNINKSYGVIIVLASNMKREEKINIITKFINTIKKQNLNGKLVIIGKTKIRISER